MNDKKIATVYSLTLHIKEGTKLTDLIQELKNIKYKYDELVIPAQTSFSLGNVTATEFERICNDE